MGVGLMARAGRPMVPAPVRPLQRARLPPAVPAVVARLYAMQRKHQRRQQEESYARLSDKVPYFVVRLDVRRVLFAVGLRARLVVVVVLAGGLLQQQIGYLLKKLDEVERLRGLTNVKLVRRVKSCVTFKYVRFLPAEMDAAPFYRRQKGGAACRYSFWLVGQCGRQAKDAVVF